MAGRFRFRLATVERLRRQALDHQRGVLAEHVREAGRIERRIQRMGDELRGHVTVTRDARDTRRLDVAVLRSHEWYKGRLHREILEAEHELAQRKQRITVERGKLADATKRVKVIEKLRARRWARHQAAVRREEQTALDEASLQMYRRRAAAAGRCAVGMETT
ncbi:MAG: flagellar export protein FliJ [Phycisphaerae bacterium]